MKKKLAVAILAILVIAAACVSDQGIATVQSEPESELSAELLAFCWQLIDDMEAAMFTIENGRTRLDRAEASALYDLADKYYVDTGCPE